MGYDLFEVQKRPDPRQDRVRAARSAILEAALHCFGECGFEGTSTRAISERAGVTHARMFYYFRTKEYLWIAAVESVLGEYSDTIISRLKASDQDCKKLAIIIGEYVGMLIQFPMLHSIFVSEESSYSDRLSWIIDNFVQWHFDLVTRIIRAGQKAGDVRDCDPALLYYFIIGVAGASFATATEYRRLTGKHVLSDEEAAKVVSTICDVIFINAPTRRRN